MVINQKWSILVVDDVDTNIDILVGILGDQYDLSVAMDGESALEAVNDDPPDLILLDIMMPGMDGYEVCQRIKTNLKTEKIPIIFVTAMTDIVDEARGFGVGAVDYITKPISPPVVQARVKTHLALYDQQRALEGMVQQRTLELRSTMKQLQAEMQRFRWVLHRADDGYLILNAEGKISFANAKARIFLDLPEKSANNELILPNETFVDIARRSYHFEPRDSWTDIFSHSSEEASCYLVRPESAVAKDFWISINTLGMYHEDESIWLIHLRDVTAQVGKQRDQRAFTSMVSHKMKTPLISMVSGWEMLEMLHTDLSPNEVSETIQGAVRGAKRLQSTVEDILGYINTPGLAVSGERCSYDDIQTITKEICAHLEIGETQIKYSQDLIEGPDLVLSHRAVELIFWELLENSLKFHPQNEPTVEISISLHAQDGVTLCVQDDGINVSPEHLSKFWLPYYQGEKDFTGQVEGMGLGLAMVAALVWRVGGTCSASNRSDKPGVIIELSLPVQK